MRLMKTVAAVGLSASLLLAVGCSDSQTEATQKVVPSGQKVKVMTVMQAQADFVKEIGKDHVDVGTLIPEGVNIWQYAPILAEQKSVEDSDVFVMNGVDVEKRWYSQLEANLKLKSKDLAIVDPSKGIETLKLQRYINPDDLEAQKQEHQDPYVYLDPVNAKKEVETIKDALVKKAPAYADDFKKNADAYEKKLDELDQKYKDMVSKAKSKELVSPYPAYQYLAKRYGLTYYVPTTFNFNSYPWDDPAKAEEVKKDLAKHGMRTVFFHQEVAPRVGEFLAEQKIHSRVLETYEGKPMDPANAKSYLQVMEQNLQSLADGLNQE
jgi:zinc transport system substrate-binding protein